MCFLQLTATEVAAAVLYIKSIHMVIESSSILTGLVSITIYWTSYADSSASVLLYFFFTVGDNICENRTFLLCDLNGDTEE